MAAVELGGVMRRRAGERGHMAGRHEAAPEQGLLIFAVNDENLNQGILNRLEQVFHF